MFTVLPVPVGPGHRTCFLFIIRILVKYYILIESKVGTTISLYDSLLSTENSGIV
jgi:hypothetical protein